MRYRVHCSEIRLLFNGNAGTFQSDVRLTKVPTFKLFVYAKLSKLSCRAHLRNGSIAQKYTVYSNSLLQENVATVVVEYSQIARQTYANIEEAFR